MLCPTRDDSSPVPGVSIVVAVLTLLGVSQNLHRAKPPLLYHIILPPAKLELQTPCCQFHWPSAPRCSSFQATSFLVRPSASSGLLPSHVAAANDKHPAFSIQTWTSQESSLLLANLLPIPKHLLYPSCAGSSVSTAASHMLWIAWESQIH